MYRTILRKKKKAPLQSVYNGLYSIHDQLTLRCNARLTSDQHVFSVTATSWGD